MKKALLFVALASLILGACTSKKEVSFGNLEFSYPSNYEIVSSEVAADSSCAVFLFKNQKDSVGFMSLQVVKEEADKIVFQGDTCAMSDMAPRSVGKYLAEKTFEVYQAQAVLPDSVVMEYGIECVDDLRILIDDPKVVEVGAFAKSKADKEKKEDQHFSSGIRATIFGGYRIIAYAQSTADDKVDGFFGIYTSVRDTSKPEEIVAEEAEEPQEEPAPQEDSLSQEQPAPQEEAPAEPAQN